MARENYNAAYIGSEDTWGFDNDTFNDETNFYADVWVIDSSEDADDSQQLSPCSLYYEVAKTDDHLFTPTEIIYDDGAGVLLIVGEQDAWSPVYQHEVIRDRLCDATLKIVPVAGHMVLLDQPDLVSNLMTDWFFNH